MSSTAARIARNSAQDRPPDRPQAAYLSLRVLAVASTVFVVITTFQSQPSPGAHGAALAVSVALAAFCSAVAAMLSLAMGPQRALQLAVALVAVISASVIVALQGNRAGFLGVFPPVSMAALLFPIADSVAVAGVAIAAVTAAWVDNGYTPASGIILNEFAILAFYVLSLFARRLRDSNIRTEQLLAELEQTRAAQALAAALAERQRLAREMHDVLAHSLSGLVLNLEGARLLADHNTANAEVKDALDRAHRLARTGLEEARRAIDTLRGDALPGPEQLPVLAADFERDTGASCTVVISGEEHGLSADASLTLYRVAQEALTNIRKHANPDRVQIFLSYMPAATRLTIENLDKPGEPPSAGTSTRTGYGLTGMRERAELLGGTLRAASTGTGFLVDLQVPT